MSRTMKILMVEDNPADILVAERALKASPWETDLAVVEDGQAALDYLFHQGPFSGDDPPTRPDLIFLDLNLPRVGGAEVLAKIKSDASLCTIPVIVLTTSDRQEDIQQMYKIGANTFIHKPVDFEAFARAVNAVGDYWTDVAKLPPLSAPPSYSESS